jgi:DNA-directed RNA polymerase alpha subunit
LSARLALSQLSELSIDEIKSINNLGVKSQTEIIEKLQEHGIEL